jgi:hypothetical protein
VLLVGIDWAERHHDVCLMATDGRGLARERIADGVAGVARLHELIASRAEEPAQVVVGIEADRGLLVGALVAAGYQVIAVNRLAASRHRERHTISGAKSDRGDARLLADLVRTDRHHHRPAKGDSGLAEAVKVLARGHQQLVWAASDRPTSCAAPCGPSTRPPWPRSAATPAVGMRWPCSAWPRPRVGPGAVPCRAGRRAAAGRSPASGRARAAAIQATLASQQLEAHQSYLLRTARWWRPRWRSSPA